VYCGIVFTVAVFTNLTLSKDGAGCATACTFILVVSCIAAVKAETDATKRFALMHEAEDILMSTGAICPIYYYTDIYMCSESLDGFFCSPLGYKYFMFASVKAAE